MFDLIPQDGQDLPPPVHFDIEESQLQLPASRGSFLCSPDGYDFIERFLKEYYQMYDSHLNRDTVTNAYAENAQFSMTAYSTSSG